MGIVNGVFIYNGNPQNGATAKLWSLDGFTSYADSTDTVQDAPLDADSIELNVTNGGLFAVDDVIRMQTEYCLIWDINGNLLYIKRGWRGTAPAPHANGIAIYDETVTPPQQDDAEPGAGQIGGSITTGVSYGGDGCYRFDAVGEGDYYVSVEYDSHRSFIHQLVETDDPTPTQLLRTRGDIMIVGADGVKRLAKGNLDDLLQMTATEPNWVGGGGFVAVREFFVPVTFAGGGAASNIRGDFPMVGLTGINHTAHMAFRVPWDYTNITNAEIIVIPLVTDGAADWDLDSDYGEVGEAYTAQSENEAANTYNVTNNTLFAVNIVPVLSAIVAWDNVGITIKLADASDDVDIVGIRFRYS